MIILGLDPGIARTGFGLINTSRPELFVRCGCITTPENTPVEDRIVMLGNDVEELIATHKPDMAVIEQVFFGKNSKTALLTAQARGVLLYTVRRHNITITSLTPLQIKSRLTGYGAASKEQIQACVTARLRLSAIPQPDDAADALAAALSVSDLSFIPAQL
jgi:crossover junction endodeoxyribonuclease RuvC